MSESYSATITDGREIYIPNWSVSVQYENLIQACKYLGQDQVIAISDLNIPSAMIAIMGAEDAQKTTELVLHYIQQVRIDGDKILPGDVDKYGMAVIVELFAHVIHSQYSDFFVSGLAKVPYQEKQSLETHQP